MCPYRMFIVFCAAMGAIVFAYFALQDPEEAEKREDREREEVCSIKIRLGQLLTAYVFLFRN